MKDKIEVKEKNNVISGLLLLQSGSESRNTRISLMNMWLEQLDELEANSCDTWNWFWGRYDLYKLEGLSPAKPITNVPLGAFASSENKGLNKNDKGHESMQGGSGRETRIETKVDGRVIKGKR